MTFAENIQVAVRYSQFVKQSIERFPDLLDDRDLAPSSLDQMSSALKKELHSIGDDEQFKQVIRQFRRKQMVRIAVRDLNGMASLVETLADLSYMADVLVGETYRWCFESAVKKWGTPIGEESNEDQTMIVLGMGKLGGHELNFSSDIDLIFVYPEKGSTQGASKSLSNDEFFTKVGQQLIQLLNVNTADGMVFRVDMRLRPFGASGQLVHNFDAFEHYYQVHGRPWERYAMVKARAMTGRAEDIKMLESLLRPFIYRRYVDFTMLESLRELKRMIALEVMKKGADRDIKLGDGGIREIEFIAQSFQLVHGGQEMLLRSRSLLPTLEALAQRGYLVAEVAESLRVAYFFLRNVENRLQMWADQQTHLLPTEPDRLHLLASSMGFESVEAFFETLNRHRSLVSHHFESVLGKQSEEKEGVWTQVWKSPVGVDTIHGVPDGWLEQIQTFKESRIFLLLSQEAKERLDSVMPLLLAQVHEQEGSGETLKRVMSVVQAVLKRSAYLVLLRESTQARALLVKLCAASPWLTAYLVKMPSLLDQLLDERILLSPLTKAALAEELTHQLLDVDDEERLMDVIRRFKHAQVFRVAASDIMGVLPLMKVSDYLTWIAEVVIDGALNKVWHFLVEKHGRPAGLNSDQIPLLVVGFGKLGGLELGYGSDLDMVYLSDDAISPSGMTDGARALDNTSFMTRLGQKLSSVLSMQTVAGSAYEVDMQLRPHGASGVLVPSLGSFFRYEREQAWVWEHQALIRTRAVAGNLQLGTQFEQERLSFLCQARDKKMLKEAVASMRLKMRQHLDKSSGTQIDLKQGIGGIIDIEFMVQFWVLSHAHQYPDLVTFSDNIRQLEALLACQVIDQSVCLLLTQAYRGYREIGHRRALGNIHHHLVEKQEVETWISAVSSLWQQVFGDENSEKQG